ncbi:MAG TPA: hypothetical protein VFH51_13705 [Myxococcota bacterium]|nr:hypothetical protein [Myxococcota bacterium]
MRIGSLNLSSTSRAPDQTRAHGSLPRPKDVTDCFQRQPARLSPHQIDILSRKVFVMVPGFCAKLAYEYLDAHQEVCHALGARTFVADVGHLETSMNNARSLRAHIERATTSDDSIILIPHSNGGHATLAMLVEAAEDPDSRDSGDLLERVVGVLALNPAIQGSEVASFGGPRLGAVTGSLLGRLRANREVVAEMSIESRVGYLQRHRDGVADVVRCLPFVSISTSYRWPRSPLEVTALALLPTNLLVRVGWGHRNDGVLSEDSQRVPGAPYIHINGVDHIATVMGNGASDLMHRGLGVLVDLMPPELQARGRPPPQASRDPDVNTAEDVITRVRLALDRSGNLQQARVLANRALGDYVLSAGLLAAALGTSVPLLFTGVPAVCLGVSAWKATLANARACTATYHLVSALREAHAIVV